MAATNNTKSVDRNAIVGETTKLMFESDTLEDPRSRTRTVPFEVICPGMPRTGTSCKPPPPSKFDMIRAERSLRRRICKF